MIIENFMFTAIQKQLNATDDIIGLGHFIKSLFSDVFLK